MAAAAIAIYVAIVLVVVDRFFGLHTAVRL